MSGSAEAGYSNPMSAAPMLIAIEANAIVLSGMIVSRDGARPEFGRADELVDDGVARKREKIREVRIEPCAMFRPAAAPRNCSAAPIGAGRHERPAS
jgi:hypothetical protein